MASDPSPPMEMRALIPRFRAFSSSSSDRSTSMKLPSGWRTGYENGFPRFVVRRMVPPRCPMPRTSSRVSGMTSSSPSRPAYPFLIPSTCHPRSIAVSTAARMTALSPGASPPPVEMRDPHRGPGLVDEAQHFTRLRVAAELRLLEDRHAVEHDLEPAASGWTHGDLGAGMAFTNGSRQTDGTRFVVSNDAVLDRDVHAILRWRGLGNIPQAIVRQAPSILQGGNGGIEDELYPSRVLGRRRMQAVGRYPTLVLLA